MIQAKTLILHIGSWKTGTTSIQAFLSRNAERLRAEGILYPRSTRRSEAGLDTAHHRLRAVLDEADGRVTRGVAEVLDGIARELRQSRCETLLLSSETFMGFRRPETLARYFSADRVIVLASLRHQAEFLNAMYYTEVCHLKVIDQPMEYLSGFDRRKLNYLFTLDRWAKIWPNAEMRISLFDRDTPARAFPVQHFLGQIGLDWELAPEDNVVEHRTQPAQATMVLRQLAASGYSDAEFFEIFQLFHRHPEFFSPIRNCFAPQVLRKIESDYAESNAKLVEKYLPEGSAGFTPLELPEPAEWGAAMTPSEMIFPAFLRSIAREAATNLT